MSMFKTAFVNAKRVRQLRPFLSSELVDNVTPSTMPHVIWVYWHQGEENAPDVVRECIESWRRNNPGWEVRVLDGDTAASKIDLSDISPDISLAALSDILRIRLMAQKGGIWVDATLYNRIPLDQWLWPLMQAGFFAFSRSSRERLVASWFLASCRGSELAGDVDRAVTRYWKGRGRVATYYWFHYLFEAAVLSSRRTRQVFARMPRVSAAGPHVIAKWVDDPAQPAPDLTGIPVLKLNWKDERMRRPEVRAHIAA